MNFIERNLAEEIFKRLYKMCHFDGHTVGVYKNEIVKLAKEYEIDLEETVERKRCDVLHK